MEYYSAIRKSEILPFVTALMELESIMLSEISQKKLTDTDNSMAVTRGNGGGGVVKAKGNQTHGDQG